MPTYLTPGVYYEPVDATPRAITALRTDIAAFVGIAERGPLNVATPAQSWRQFQSTFGSFTGSGYLAYAVKGFFENGGRKCYIVRVADRDVATSASIVLLDSNTDPAKVRPAWRIEASSPGVWGNQLAVQLRTAHQAQTRTVVEPGSADRTYSRVLSVSNFDHGTLVRLFQQDAAKPNALRVVEKVDGQRQRLIWNQPLDPDFAPGLPIFLESIEYTLAVYWLGRLVAIYEALSIVPKHPRYAPNIVRNPLSPRDDADNSVLPPPPPLIVVPDKIELGRDFRPPDGPDGLVLDTSTPVPLSGGLDGLETLSADDFIGEAEDLMAPYDLREANRRGLQALVPVNEVSLVAVPDIHIRPVLPPRTAPLPPPEPDPCLEGSPEPTAPHVPPIFPALPPVFSDEEIFRVESALIAHCEDQRDRFALLDPPYSAARDNELGTGATMAWRSRFDSKYAALYYPWLRVLDPLRLGGQLIRELPPSGHVAGLIAGTDLAVGVHKAPANGEVEWVEDTTAFVGDSLQAELNPRGINAIRIFSGRGILLYGARTVSSDPDWRYVNVRRLIIMIEQALDLATQWVVFEPNDVYTRGKVSLAITTFLETLWRCGALVGTQPDQAFYVKCDESNNPPAERELGHFRVDIGVAPSIPYEFVVLRLGRTAEELEITEQS